MLLLLLCIIALSSCAVNQTQEIEESDDFRVGVLYEHTVLMIEYSNPDEIKEIGLLAEHIVDSTLLSTDDKLTRLTKAYNTTNSDIGHLEDVMVEMMDKWAEVTNTLNNTNS